MARWIRRIVILMLLLAGLIYLKENPSLRKTLYSEEPIHVRIDGPVKYPGIYSIEAGSNGWDLVNKAGGFLPASRKPTEEKFLEQPLEDGQVLNLGKR
ncbi:hypothetical protein P3G55_11715 [Leptospira sp. 96542]|nr:hypothetical protein [Leptospira sp. 96542]